MTPNASKEAEPKSTLTEYNLNDKQELVLAEKPRFTKPPHKQKIKHTVKTQAAPPSPRSDDFIVELN